MFEELLPEVNSLWISRSMDKVCNVLDVEVPAEGSVLYPSVTILVYDGNIHTCPNRILLPVTVFRELFVPSNTV